MGAHLSLRSLPQINAHAQSFFSPADVTDLQTDSSSRFYQVRMRSKEITDRKIENIFDYVRR